MSNPPPQAGQREIVREHFDTASTEWGQRYERQPRRMSDLDLQMRRETALAMLEDILADARTYPLAALDLGCGPGGLLAGIDASRLTVHGVDLSPEMIETARRTYRDHDYRVADATDLPYADSSMDVVFSTGVLEYIPEPERVLAEVLRILRPGGSFVVSFPNLQSIMRSLSRMEVGVERFTWRALRRLRGRSLEGDPAPHYRHKQWRPQHVRHLLERAGFTIQRRVFHTIGLYGMLGRLSASLWLSRALSRRLRDKPAIAAWLGTTMVVHARVVKASAPDGGQAP